MLQATIDLVHALSQSLGIVMDTGIFFLHVWRNVKRPINGGTEMSHPLEGNWQAIAAAVHLQYALQELTKPFPGSISIL